MKVSETVERMFVLYLITDRIINWDTLLAYVEICDGLCKKHCWKIR